MSDVSELQRDARERATYLDGYSTIVADRMYGGERPSGIWNLERSAHLLREQANTITTLQSTVSRLREALVDLLEVVDSAGMVKRGDFYHERKKAREALKDIQSMKDGD